MMEQFDINDLAWESVIDHIRDGIDIEKIIQKVDLVDGEADDVFAVSTKVSSILSRVQRAIDEDMV